MATNEQLLDELREMKGELCTRIGHVEVQVDDHERRILGLETALPIQLKALVDGLAEFKVEWRGNMRWMFIIIVLLIVVLAGALGVKLSQEAAEVLPAVLP